MTSATESLKNTGPTSRDTETCGKSGNTTSNQLTLFAEDSPARTFHWPVNREDWKAIEAVCSGKLPESWELLNRTGLSSKMFPASFRRIKEGTSRESSTRWMNSGIAWHGVYLTRNSSEWLNGADVCSLSEVLEGLPAYECYSTKEIPQWFTGELDRRTYGHHISIHFRSGRRASSTEISRFLSNRARFHLRVLTVKECERLQGFPDQWTLVDTAPLVTRWSLL